MKNIMENITKNIIFNNSNNITFDKISRSKSRAISNITRRVTTAALSCALAMTGALWFALPPCAAATGSPASPQQKAGAASDPTSTSGLGLSTVSAEASGSPGSPAPTQQKASAASDPTSTSHSSGSAPASDPTSTSHSGGSAPAPDPTSHPAEPSQTQNDASASSASGDKASGSAPAQSNLNIAAKSAVLMDAASGRVLYKQNPDEKLPPASVTKVMTMLLICEAIDSGRVTTSDSVTVSDRAAGMGGSQMYMEPGETHTLDELLTGISMVSANDACVAAAEYISGSVEIFVEEMNKRASALGLQNTHFVNTNGLPVADHYSSAYDIAVISAELLKHDIIIPYLTAQSGTATVGKNADKQTTLEMINTNKLLRSYSGAIGIKTGFTQDAGYCLSAAAERNDLRLIAVVLGCESSKIRFAEASRLLDYGFATYEAVQIAAKDELVGSASVDKGMMGFTDLRAGENIQILVPKGTSSDISYSVKPYTDLAAPIKAGQKAGTLTITKNGEKTAEYDLFADTDIKKAGLKTLMIHSIEKLMKG